MSSVYLYGLGGHCKVVAEVLRAMNVEISGFFDDDPKVVNQLPNRPQAGISLCPPGKFIAPSQPMIISIGDNSLRKRISQQLGEICFGSALHPSAVVSPSANIEAGSVVFHQAVIQAETRIGKHVIVNTAACIDHDNVIADFVHVSPNATLCGNVHIGEGSWIGAGAVVIPGVRIGRWVTVGAGSVVLHDLEDGVTAVGSPARIIRCSQVSDG